MVITSEFLQQRLKTLDELEKRAWANLNAIIGAREEALNMIKYLEKPPEQKQEQNNG